MKKYTSMIDHHLGENAAARVIRMDHQFFELSLSDTASPFCEDELSAIVLENEAGKWRALLVVKELSGWYWDEIRSELIHHACNSAFMGPEVFQNFIHCLDEAAGEEWDLLR